MFKAIPEIMIEAARIMLGAHYIDNEMNVKPGDSNFVTKYDVEVQNFLVSEFLKIFPDAIIIGEESANNHTDRLKDSLCIIIDPIDGTTNFIHDYKSSSISVGISNKGELVFGAVYNPYHDNLYFAEKDKGAFLRNKGNITKISVSHNNLANGLAAFGTSPYYRDEFADKTFETAKWLFMKTQDLRRSGSAAIDLSAVASGALDIFFEYRLSPWDFAGAAVILTEAGGIITQFDGSPITLDKPCSILAGTKEAYTEVIKNHKF